MSTGTSQSSWSGAPFSLIDEDHYSGLPPSFHISGSHVIHDFRADTYSTLAPVQQPPAKISFDVDLYARLQKAFDEIKKLKEENSEEHSRRVKAESDLIILHQIHQKSIGLQGLRREEITPTRVKDEAFAKEHRHVGLLEHQLQKLKQELEQMKNERDEYIKRCEELNEEKSALLKRVGDSDRMKESLVNDLEAYKYIFTSLQSENTQLQDERDKAVRNAAEIQESQEQIYSQFSFSELDIATEGFNESSKIGEGRFGCVYKGTLRNTAVAIKMFQQESLQGSQFEQEVKVLSKVRHPHLVTLLGACSEVSALVYEYLPGGNLEDRLACTGSSPPLKWQARSRIIGEICSALIFLHSNKPLPVVHGDLKPANILLDANLISKLSDFGIAQLLIEANPSSSTLIFYPSHPAGSSVGYSDPEYIASGELTLKSDVYALGLIILRLLTGKPPVGIVKLVEEALLNDALHTIVDDSAGEWPYVQVEQLARIGLRCAETSRNRRPDLKNDVWNVVGPLMKNASLSPTPSTSESVHEESRIPSYFICPIFQEIMKDPQIAADGYTYDAEAIRGWFEGHETSPMTNLAVTNRDLIPNHALRSAIQEYLQMQ